MESAIFYMLIYIMEALILWWYCSNLFETKYSRKRESSIIFIGYSCLFLVFSLNNFVINLLSILIINYVVIFLLYSVRWQAALFHSLILITILTLSELILIGLNSQIASNILYEHTSDYYSIILVTLSKLLYFVVLRFILKLLKGKKENNHTSGIVGFLLNTIPIISIFIIVSFIFILLQSNIQHHFELLLSICSIFLLLINIIIFWIHHYTQKKNYEFTNMQIQLQKEYDTSQYYKSLFQQNENQAILIHDINKHLQSIAKLNEQNNQEKIKIYIEQLINSSNLKESAIVCDNEFLNSILCYYIQLCKQRNIQFKIDIRKNQFKNIEYNDLTSLFCNLLDNAVEACSDLSNAYIELSVTYKQNADITIVNIQNTCETIPSFNKSGNPISTKKDQMKHGFGLKSVNRILKKYNGNIKMYYEPDTVSFHTIITLKFSAH